MSGGKHLAAARVRGRLVARLLRDGFGQVGDFLRAPERVGRALDQTLRELLLNLLLVLGQRGEVDVDIQVVYVQVLDLAELGRRGTACVGRAALFAADVALRARLLLLPDHLLLRGRLFGKVFLFKFGEHYGFEVALLDDGLEK